MSRKKKNGDVVRDNLSSDLRSPDEVVRARALGLLCPCRNGWELFQQHAHIVTQLTKDSSPSIRAGALHILSDAALLQSIADAEYRFDCVEDLLRKKRPSRSRTKKAQSEVRRSGRFTKRRGTFVLR